MEKQIIWRGLLAGAAAGVLTFIFARIFIEPVIELAIGYEDGIGAAREALEGAASGHDHGAEASKASPAVFRPTSAWVSACWRSALPWAPCSRWCSR